MRPQDRDPGYVWDMLDTARTIHDFTTGVTLEAYLHDRKLQLAVERAVEIIGLDVAGVDMLESNEGPRVIEVNSSPGLRGIEKATEVDVAARVIEHAERLVREQRPQAPL